MERLARRLGAAFPDPAPTTARGDPKCTG